MDVQIDAAKHLLTVIGHNDILQPDDTIVFHENMQTPSTKIYALSPCGRKIHTQKIKRPMLSRPLILPDPYRYDVVQYVLVFWVQFRTRSHARNLSIKI